MLRTKDATAVQITLGLGKTVGGGEYTALIVNECLNELGYKVKLICKQHPDLSKYKIAFDIERLGFDDVKIFKYPKLPKIFKLYHYLIYPIITPKIPANLYFNTSADSHPFVIPLNAIIHKLPVIYYVTAIPLTPPYFTKKMKKEVYKNNIVTNVLKTCYYDLFRKISKKLWSNIVAHFIACSNFVAGQVDEALGVQSKILYTPVDIGPYEWKGESKENYAVVMGRTVPSKNYEVAISACKEANVKLMMLLAIQDQKYYNKIVSFIKKEEMEQNVKILINAPLKERAEILKRAKVFIHCRVEAGAKAVREAMAAGCVPVVPHIGGQSEFVPREYTYSNQEELPQKILYAMNVSTAERQELVNMSKKHDKTEFKAKLKQIITEIVSNR